MLPTLVLAAGLGKRLDPLTRLVAKAALPLAGRTIIERAIEWLARQGVEDVVVNLHHCPESIAAIVGDGTHLGVRVRYSWEPVLLGSAGGPRHALPLLDADTLLIVNAEPLCDFPLEPLVESHRASGADVTLAVVPNPSPDEFNGLRAGPDGFVTEILPKGQAEGTWHFVGVQVAERRVFAALPDNEPAETIWGIYRDMIGPGLRRVRICPVDTTPVHVGTPLEYLAAAIAAGHTCCCSDAVIEPGALDVSSSARLRRTVVWPATRVGPDADLTDCIVVTGASVPAGFAARRVIIAPSGLASAGDRVERHDGLALFPLDAARPA